MGKIESKLITNGPATHIIPQDWKVERMEQIAQILGGGTPDTTVQKYWNGEILWATPTDIVPMDGKQLTTTSRMITKSGLKNSSARLIPAKSIIVCTRASIGELVITTHDTSFNQGNTGIVPNENINYEFLAYILKTLVTRMKNLASGSTFLELSKRDFRSLKVFLPPLPEQIKIAAILSSVDEAIDKTRVVIAKTERLKKGLMQLLLTRGMPGWHSEWKESKVGEIPGCWEEKKLGDLISIKHGYGFSSKYFEKNGDYILLTPGNFFEKGGFRYLNEKEKYFIGDYDPDFMLKKGDLLVAMTEQAYGLLGSVAIIPEDERFLHNQRLGLINNLRNNLLASTFLYYLFN